MIDLEYYDVEDVDFAKREAYSNSIAIPAALAADINSEVYITKDIPHEFGNKWNYQFHHIRQSLINRHGDDLPDLLKLARRWFTYTMHNEAAIRVYLHEVHKVGTKERLLEIGTAEGFAKSTDWASVTFSVLSTLNKPDTQISSGLQFTQMPNASDVMTALGLIWFFEASSHWGTNTQQALDILCEANDAVELAYGETMWNEGATHGKGNILSLIHI